MIETLEIVGFIVIYFVITTGSIVFAMDKYFKWKDKK